MIAHRRITKVAPEGYSMTETSWEGSWGDGFTIMQALAFLLFFVGGVVFGSKAEAQENCVPAVN